MKETNNKQNHSSSWYDEWHSTKHHAVAHWVIFLIIIIGSFLLLRGQIKDWIMSLNEPGVVVTVTKSNAQLAMGPQTKTVKVGDSFSADVILDTGNKPVDGVDIYALHYDPTILNVVDDIPAQKGTQITPGTIMSLTAANTVDEKTGSIKYGAVSEGGGSFSGKGVLATIHFKAVATGIAYLRFDFSQGSTVDSNAAYKGKDQLTSVVDAIYTVKSK